MPSNQTIKYKITFHTDWHCGSGLSASADIDSLPIKNEDGLPYVPGRTIKGLLREAVDDLHYFSKDYGDEKSVKEVFGYFDNNPEKAIIGSAHFSNAELPKEDASEIRRCNLAKYLYRTLSNTAIDASTGIADTHSLRKIEVTIPCTLEGMITGVPDGFRKTIIDAMKYTKRLGQGRNRGLGRCTITVEQ